jgi:diguanylate cyclase (GGDEF)-like protein/PAS domain S-box-containing protein
MQEAWQVLVFAIILVVLVVGLAYGFARRTASPATVPAPALEVAPAPAVADVDALAHLLEAIPEGLCICDLNGCIRLANSACANWFGAADKQSLVGKMPSHFLAAESSSLIALQFAGLRPEQRRAAVFEHDLMLQDGGSFPVEICVSRCADERGQDAVLLQFRDIALRRRYEERWVEQLMVDDVTELPNRRMLMDRLHQALAMGRRGAGACAVMMIDLDHFKRINETGGHNLGDALLAAAAQRLRVTVREADTVARFGGDEFVVVLSEPDPHAAPLRVEYAAQRVVAAFQEPFEFGDIQIVTTASVGIAVWPTDGDDPDTLIRNADTAMYEIKQSTRNGFCLFNREMNLRVRNSLRIDASLRLALERNELRVVFQPIVDANSRRVMKAEALLRWHNPELGNIPPDRFIPLAEETGQIVAIGAWVLEESCRQLLLLQAQRGDGLPLMMSVNVSARQLSEPDFAASVAQTIAQFGVPPHQLELELTERILVDDNPVVHDNIRALDALGVSLSLDDFGTGYSSLSYLTRFPLDTVKLDRSFVQDIDSNPQSLQLATAVIAMCSSLGLALVAEGVENGAQAELLRSRGCGYLQGYHFGRPVPPAELARVPGFVSAVALNAA